MPLAYQKKELLIYITSNKAIFAFVNKTLKHVKHQNVLILL